jgi:hypothetical protein
LDEPALLQALSEEIKAIKATLDEAKADGQILNEAQTEFIIIDPLLKRLGYSPLEVLKRNHDGVTNNFPDYTLLAGKPQKWFLEAKRLDLNLQDGEAAQAVNYANNQGAEWAVLTNGRKWYIYNVHLPKPLPEKRVLQIEDLFNDEQSLQILLLLSKPAILNNDLHEAWLFQQVTELIDEQLKTPNSEVRGLIRRLGSETTKLDLTDEIIGKVLLFAVPSLSTSTSLVKSETHTPKIKKGASATQELRHDHQGEINTTFYTFDEIARDIGLATYRKPRAIKLGDITEDVKTWADVARMTVAHIGKTSTLPPLPYSAGNKGKNYFLNTTATHANNKKMQSHRTVVIGSESVFVDTNRSTLNICACLMMLMKTVGIPFNAISVSID